MSSGDGCGVCDACRIRSRAAAERQRGEVAWYFVCVRSMQMGIYLRAYGPVDAADRMVNRTVVPQTAFVEAVRVVNEANLPAEEQRERFLERHELVALYVVAKARRNFNPATAN